LTHGARVCASIKAEFGQRTHKQCAKPPPKAALAQSDTAPKGWFAIPASPRRFCRQARDSAVKALQNRNAGFTLRRPRGIDHGSDMGLIKLIAAPIRSLVHFPLFQLGVVVAIILYFQAADDNTVAGKIFDGLDKLTDESVQLFSQLFTVKSFTRSGLTAGLMIGYVYLFCLLILSAARVVIRAIVDFLGWSNAFGLRNTIARERGIAAYRAWVPFERIRPADIPQEQWEATFAWPPDDKPPYPPLGRRFLHGVLSYLIVIAGAAVLVQVFTPFPVLIWFGKLVEMISGVNL
jgi:hypothetical protein